MKYEMSARSKMSSLQLTSTHSVHRLKSKEQKEGFYLDYLYSVSKKIRIFRKDWIIFSKLCLNSKMGYTYIHVIQNITYLSKS